MGARAPGPADPPCCQCSFADGAPEQVSVMTPEGFGGHADPSDAAFRLGHDDTIGVDSLAFGARMPFAKAITVCAVTKP